MTARVTGQRFRQRKLSTKQNLPVVREHEVEQLADDDASRHIPKVETGVEKGEEIVSHAIPFSAFTFSGRDFVTTSARVVVAKGSPAWTYRCRDQYANVSIGAPSSSRHLGCASSTRLDWWKDCTTVHPNTRCCRQ